MKRLLSLVLLLLPLALWAAKSDVVKDNSAGVSVSFSSGNSYEWEWDSSNNRLRSTNYNINSSTSQTTISISCPASCTFSFDYAVSSESGYDKLTILLDNQTIVNAVSGSVSNTYNGTLASGSHSLVLKYVKDVSAQSGDDRAYLSNVRFIGNSSPNSGSFGDNLNWEVDDRWLTINGSGSMPDYTSADQAPWYQYKSSILGVTIAPTIDHIGNYAFAGYTNLIVVRSLLNEAGVLYSTPTDNYTYNPLSIGAHAFEGCTRLEEIYSYAMGHNWEWDSYNNEWYDICNDLDYSCPHQMVGTRITEIGDYAFYGCSSLPDISVNSGTTIGANSFQSCTSLEGVWGEVAAIGNSAFSYCSNLNRIRLNSGISRIGNSAFYNCSNLGSISIPSSVTEIGRSAFNGCNNLTSVNIPANVSSISQDAFYNCSKAVINIPNTVTRVEDDAFYNCKKLASVSTNLSYIGYEAFYGCTSLTSVEISSDIEYIGSKAFSGCTGLSSVTFPQTTSNLYDVGNNIFTSTPYLSTLVPDNGVKYAGPIALNYDGTVINLTLKDGTMFMDLIFSSNTGSNLQSLRIPGTMRKLPQQSFFHCTGLSEVIFEHSTTPIIVDNNKYSDGIGGGIFEMCPITNITIDRDIELTYKYKAHSYDGYQCGLFYCRFQTPSIQEIVIGENVTTLPDYLLYAQYNGSSNLQSIICKGQIPPTCTSNAFYGVPTTTNIHVPCGALEDYQDATGWSIFSNIQIDGACEYTRDVTLGRYGTICLPKGVAQEDLEDCGAVFYNIVYAVTNTNDDITGIVLEEETGNLVAGKPYIFCATADELVLPYTGAAVAEPIAANGLVGNLSETPLVVPPYMYVLSNNKIRKLNGGTATAGQNRAYIDLTHVEKRNDTPAAAPNRVILNAEGSDVATELEHIQSEDVQKVIRDGQLLIIRDGKTYNVLGTTL